MVTPAMVTDALVLGLFGAAPLALAAVGFTLICYLSGFINVAYGENSIIDDLHACVRTGVLPSATTGTKCNRLSTKSGGAHRLLREDGRAMTNKGARLEGHGSQRFGTVTNRDRVPPGATGDG